MSASTTSPATAPGGTAALGPLRAWLLRHETKLVCALVAVAAAVRVVRWQVTAVMFNDGPVFLSLAEALERLDLRTALGHPFHPLYPALVALADLVLGDLETAGVTVSVVSGSLSVAVLHRLVRQGLSVAHGVVAAALLAFHPIAIEYTGDVQSEGLYLFLFLSTATAAVSALRRDSLRRAVLAGALAGAAYLTRPEGLGLVAVAGIVALLGVLRGRWPLRRAVALGAALGVGVTIVASPYVVWLRAVEGSWTVTQKKNVSALVGLERAPVDGPPSGLPGPELPDEEGPPADAETDGGPPSSRPSAPAEAEADGSAGTETSWLVRSVLSVLDVGQTHVRAVHYG
ncbi:MAG: glycosyltransferase family 39 protein, partial [Myxococcota bacterium]|nr:glycosyltransferase family 39 protein [Myxococcota bacterium]